MRLHIFRARFAFILATLALVTPLGCASKDSSSPTAWEQLQADGSLLASDSAAVSQALAAIPASDQGAVAFLSVALAQGASDSVTPLFSGFSPGSASVEDAVLLALLGAAQEAENDLKNALEGIQATNDAKKRLRDALKGMQTHFGGLRDRLGQEFLRRSQSDPEPAAQDIETFQEIRPVSVGASFEGAFSGSDYVPGQVLDDGSATATFGATLSCPNAPSPIELRFHDLRAWALVASTSGTSSVSLSIQVAGPTPIAVEARISGVSPQGPVTCQQTVTYRRKKRGTPKILDPTIAQSLTVQRDQAIQDQAAVFTQLGTLAQQAGSAEVAELVAEHARAQRNRLLALGTFGQFAQEARERADSMSKLSEQAQKRMKIYMDRRGKAEQALSAMMQKISDTETSLVSNLK